MMRTFYKMFFPFCIFIALTKITSVCSASAKAMTPQLTPTVGSTVKLQWKTIGLDWLDFSLRKSGFKFHLARVFPWKVSLLQDTKRLFGRRLLIVYNTTESLFTATLKDIRYNEEGTFHLGLVDDFWRFSKFGNSTIRITSILGSARFCMKPLETQYTVNENDVLKFKHNICGNPKPILKWKLGEVAMFESSFNSTLIDNGARQYSYVSETRLIKRKYCGKKITFKANNEQGSAEKSYTLDVNFTPSSVSVISKHVHNDSCVQLFWPGDDTGKCVVTYHVQVDEGDIYNTSSTYFTLCNSKEVFYISIWNSYKGVVGDKLEVEVAKISTTKSKTNNKKELQDNNQRMSTVIITASISLVVTLVLIIVIFVILIYKVKPRPVSIISSLMVNANCYQIVWHGKDTEKCLITYHLQVDDGENIYNTFNTHFRICNLTKARNVSIWSSYKGIIGDKIKMTIPKYLALKQERCNDMYTIIITAAATLAAALILNIFIFAIMKYKGYAFSRLKHNKQVQETRTTDAYEVAGLEASNNTDLKIKKIKPVIYTALVKTDRKEKVGLMPSQYADPTLEVKIHGKYADLITDNLTKDAVKEINSENKVM